MIEQLAESLWAYTDRQIGDSPYHTVIDGVGVLRSDRPTNPVHRMMQPAICIVAQGAKKAIFGHEELVYQAGQALVIGVDTPSIGCVLEASEGKPCLVLAFELDLAILRSVAEELSNHLTPRNKVSYGVCIADVSGPLADCALRIIRLLETPKAIPIIYPLIMREVCYWLLTGPQGGEIAQLVLAHNTSQGVITAIQHLRQHYQTPILIEVLAKIAHLSSSAFHRQFKALTYLSPRQYQKQLRLLEARRQIWTSAVTMENVAYNVGYESPSQFNREYVRMFGIPPKQDKIRYRETA
nr:AraC family transcriptional regulator [uncultured Tolumonas sp.]